MLVLAVAITVLPGLVWLWIFYQTDVYEPEPRSYVLGTFALGALAVVPAFLLERALGRALPWLDLGRSAHLVPVLAGCFLVIGPVEEICKFLVVRTTIYRHPEFDEPLDGIIYAAAAALGFATLENVLYVVDFAHGGRVRWELLALRSLLALPGHVIFSSTWGYALGRRRFDAKFPVVRLLLAAACLHAAYDFVLIYPPARPAIPLLLAAMVPLIIRQVRELKQRSPFAPGHHPAAPAARVARDGDAT